MYLNCRAMLAGEIAVSFFVSSRRGVTQEVPQIVCLRVSLAFGDCYSISHPQRRSPGRTSRTETFRHEPYPWRHLKSSEPHLTQSADCHFKLGLHKMPSDKSSALEKKRSSDDSTPGKSQQHLKAKKKPFGSTSSKKSRSPRLSPKKKKHHKKPAPFDVNTAANQPDPPSDIITLSSGSEAEFGLRQKSSSPEQTESLDRLSDWQSGSRGPPKSSGKKKKKAMAKSKAGDLEGNLSDGEINEDDSEERAGISRGLEVSRPLSSIAGVASNKNTHTFFGKTNVLEVDTGKKDTNGKASVVLSSRPERPKPVVVKASTFVPPKYNGFSQDNTSRPKSGSSSGASSARVKSSDVEFGLHSKTDGGSTEGDEPLVRVTFLNNYLAEKYTSVFRKLVDGIVTREKDNMAKIRAAVRKDIPTTAGSHECFEVDDNVREDIGASDDGEDDSHAHRNGFDLADIPDLSASNTANTVTEPPKPSFTPAKKECFNCGGGHTLMECTEPKNWAAINKRRTDFFNSASSSPVGGPNRYHEATSDDDRIGRDEFPDCQPGKISADLRSALGLDSKEVPEWIFRMRSCGYPPGYIRSCVVEESGLDFINDAGDTPSKEDSVRYNLDKLPVFPGFSAPFTNDVLKGPFIRRYGQPLRVQSQETVVSFLQHLVHKPAVKARSPSPETADMDVSDEESGKKSAPTFYECTVPASPSSSEDDEKDAEKVQKPAVAATPVVLPKPVVIQVGGGSASAMSKLRTAALPAVQVVQRETTFEMVEAGTTVTVHETNTTMLLKTSSVPNLGSFSGVTLLPNHDKFAEGMVAFPFEEASENTGRYSAIRSALEASRKRKRDGA